MPGNEVRDRVHNFFAQDSLSQGEQHSPVAEGNFPALSNILGVGSQRQTGGLSSNTYNLQNSETTRAGSSYPFNVQRGLESAQSTPWNEFAKSQSQSQQPNLNGNMYGNQYYQTKQDESRFLAVNTGSNQCNLASGASSFHELQRGAGLEQQARGPVRSEPSGGPISFDLFGGQQMNRQQSNMLQSLQRQQSGLNEMQQLQQQVMFMKMQEFQRQQQLQQLDASPQHPLNQVPPLAKVASSSHSPASVNGTTNSGAANYAPATEIGNTNWLQRGSPVLQGSSNGFNPTNYGQAAQHLMGLIPQHIDQSLYGTPVANSRGSLNQFLQMGTKKPAVQPMPTFTGSFPGNECAALSDQVSGPDGTSITRQGLQGESFLGHTVSQAQSNAINIKNLQQANIMQKGSALQDFCGRLDLTNPSETSQEKAAPTSSPENEVGLDPTEERILFGSDDSIWNAFSKSPNRNEEGDNLFDSAGLLTGFPSLQGGSWSALMQSAVEEASSSDVAPQEEWSGLNFHSAEISSGNHNLMYNNGRHKASSAEDKLPPAPSLNFSVQPSDSTNMNNSFHNVQEHRFPYERGQNMQTNSLRLAQSSDGGSKSSDFGPLQTSVTEASQKFSNTSHPLDTEMIARRVSSNLTAELGGARQPWMNSANWGVLGSALPSGDAASSISSDNSSKRLQVNNQNKCIQDEVFHGGVALKSSPRCISAVGMEHAGSSVASLQGNSEVFSFYNSATVPNSSMMKGAEETKQSLQNNNQSNYWTNADLVKSNASESLGVLQRHVMKDSQVLHSSPDVGDKEFKMYEMENSDKKDNSNDSYHSNSHPHSSAGGVRENALSDASDSRCLLMGNQKLSNQGGLKNLWPPKFQYHPLGNLNEDADPPCSMKQSTHSQSVVQHNSLNRQSKVFGQVPQSQAELDKGQLPDVLMDGKGSHEVHLQSSPNMLQLIQKVDQSRECGSVALFGHSEHKASSEMPEADESDEPVSHHQRSQSSAPQGFGLQLGLPSGRASVRSHSLSSQSAIQAVSSSHSSHAAVDTGEKNQGLIHQAQSLLPPSDLSQEGLKNNRFGIPGSSNNETSMYTMPGKLSPAVESLSGFPYMGGQIKNPNVVRTTEQVSTNQSVSVSFDKHVSCHTEKGDSHRGSASGQTVEASLPDGAGNTQDKSVLPACKSQLSNANGTVKSIFTNHVSSQEPVSVSQPLVSGIAQQDMSSKMSSSMWTNFPPPQQPFGAQYDKNPSHISQSHQLNIVESSLSAPGRRSDQYSNRGGNLTPQIGTSSVNSLGSAEGEEQRAEGSSPQVPLRNVDLVQKMNDSQGRESIDKYIPGGSPANSASMQRDIEAFGRSLKPNNLSHQNYSLLNQMRAMKQVEIDPSNRAFKRMKVADSSAGALQVPSGDTGMLGLSGPENLHRSISSQQVGKMTPQDVLALCQDDSQSGAHSNNTNSVKLEQTQNGPQLEPSWFNQCRTLKNRQMLQMYDARRAAAMKTVKQPFTIGKSSSSLHALNTMLQVIPATADRSSISNLGPNSIPSSAAIEHFSSPPTLPVNAGHQHQILKPMKRKRATSDHTPWYKEVSVDSRSNQTISLAEREWARAANRLTEKVEEGIDFIEEGALGVKAKRRVLLTTQLMQQLLRPPPAAILSAEANSEHESVAYSIARLALGDACSMVCISNGALNMPHDDKTLLPENCNTSERVNKHCFAKAVEELMGRARRLESDFLRLDKRASLLDAIVEGQDQEKFAVINRFAKFHGRGQSDGAETSSSSGPAAHTHKPFPQRYITALPIPKNLPSGVHCLSL
uniref:Uncharacterized protein isoform X2 n=1 Tax=Nicotiana tabacum TaxID=4097 RepID=A0A1S4AM82_TOBAC|nr:PREDICTED: uncharacterized protein LOC107799002 isoform X2 [Nicotiana tabacum]